MPEPSFDELLASSTKTALKLEFRDQYMTDDPAYLAWRAGNVDQAIREYAGWTETASSATARGVEIKRIRVVSEPMSDYIAFEHAVTAAVNVAGGEMVRWVPRSRVSAIALPGNDAWIFDEATVQFCLFAGDGRFVGNEVSAGPETVELCLLAFAAAWELGIDHELYSITL
ncbi:DUF6879 family protein [Kribbella italica]|uniref:DUF6879 domain-containing protein n=1 Tax=Kribbella italica TaxID=1540520 RepID=A0A7W9JEC1_9ACTN|nr:DUF6879 family protein [Kribbella italica]MBB5840591.1 hypothetical protein [Kribbella italica]